MSSKTEREKIAGTIANIIIPLCSNGDKEAAAYLKRVFYIVRMIDDLNDEDYPVAKEEIIKGFFLLIADIPTNSFYKNHSSMLTGVHIISFKAWQDANGWGKANNELKKLYAHVLRDYICELFILVAYLTGGDKLMKKASIKVRTAFLKKPEGNRNS